MSMQLPPISNLPPTAGAPDPAATSSAPSGAVSPAPNPVATSDLPPPDKFKLPGRHSGPVNGQVPLFPPPIDPNDLDIRELAKQKMQEWLRDHQQNGLPQQNDVPVPPPSKQKFDVTMLLELLLKVGTTEFQEATRERRADTQVKVDDMRISADKTREAGESQFKGSLLGGLGSIAVGAFGIASAGVNLKGALKGGAALDGLAEGSSPELQQKTYTNASQGYTAIGGVLQSSGAISQGSLNIGQGKEEEDATVKNSEKGEADAAAAADDSLVQNDLSMTQQYGGVLQDYLQKESGIVDHEDQANMTLAHNV